MKNSPILTSICILAFLIVSCSKETAFKHDSAVSLEENLQTLVDSYVAAGIPGMVLMVDHPTDGIHIIESGKSNLENGLALSKDHLFHSASLMKTYTAVCIFKLEEAGLLTIEDKIKSHLPTSILEKIPNGDEATIRSILNHSSGIPDFAAQEDYVNDLIAYTDGGQEPMDELEYIKNVNPDFAVGSKHSYSNSGYYILSLIVSQTSGKSFEAFFEEEIIQALGLTHTYYKNHPAPVDYTAVPQYYIDWSDDGVLSNSSTLENLSTQTFEGYSGLLASIEDYHTFIKALFLDGSLLTQSSVDRMKAISHSSGFGYGQGLEVILSKKYPDKYGHKGGTQSSFFYYPETNLIIISMINYSFYTGESPYDKLAIVPDRIGKNNTLIGEIELCLFK